MKANIQNAAAVQLLLLTPVFVIAFTVCFPVWMMPWLAVIIVPLAPILPVLCMPVSIITVIPALHDEALATYTGLLVTEVILHRGTSLQYTKLKQ
jgi:hypothetical protein